MKITSLKLQKNKTRVNVFLDGKFAFGLDLETVTELGLYKGQVLTRKRIDQLLFNSFFEKLYNRVLNFLSYRPRSEKEVKDYLYKRFQKVGKIDAVWQEKLQEKIFKKLRKQKLLDDLEFASWWLNQRLDFKFFGKRRLQAELFAKGIKREIIDKLLAEIKEEKLLKLAKKLLEKKKKIYKNLGHWRRKEKLIGHLQRRGFSWEIIKTAIDDFMKKD